VPCFDVVIRTSSSRAAAVNSSILSKFAGDDVKIRKHESIVLNPVSVHAYSQQQFPSVAARHKQKSNEPPRRIRSDGSVVPELLSDGNSNGKLRRRNTENS
jgi:hypothetical protein